MFQILAVFFRNTTFRCTKDTSYFRFLVAIRGPMKIDKHHDELLLSQTSSHDACKAIRNESVSIRDEKCPDSQGIRQSHFQHSCHCYQNRKGRNSGAGTTPPLVLMGPWTPCLTTFLVTEAVTASHKKIYESDTFSS